MPSGTGQPSALLSPTPPPTRPFPSLTGPSRTFVYDHDGLFPVSNVTKTSRFVLYDSGAFVLHFESAGDSDGAYTDTNGAIAFEWKNGQWTATGALKGDSLTVQYSMLMQGADFEDAVYVLQR
jgi:hypothetical protein